MEYSENGKIDSKTMFRLIRELWYESNYGEEPMKNVAYRIYEVNKSGCKKNEVARSFKFLIDKGFIKEISKEPYCYEFTEMGRNIRTEKDVENIINNTA